jgi:hypothetical protein
VRSGSVEVPVYHSTHGPYHRYTLCYYVAGRRKRQTFSDPVKARTEAKRAADLLAAGKASTLELTISIL